MELIKNSINWSDSRTIRVGIWIVALTFAVVVCVGCGDPDATKPAIAQFRVVTDDLGRSVKLPMRTERAVSLAPSLTEAIFAAGAGDRLIGDTTYCNYPPEAQAIAKVGDTQTPNIEAIVALKPQVVFVTTASQLESFTRTLDEQGIAVFVTNPKSMDDVVRNLRQFGDIFGTLEQAEKTSASLNQRIAEQRRTADELASHPRVFLQISNEPLFTIGKDSFLNQVIEYAGGKSVTRDVATAFPKLSKETALALNPEVIILSDSDDNREPNAVFSNSPAVRNGRVYRINADIISRPGPRLVDAMEEISRDIRGQARENE